MFLVESCQNSSIESEIYTYAYAYGTINKICSQQLRFVFFSNTFIIDFSVDELNTANISFNEMNKL